MNFAPEVPERLLRGDPVWVLHCDELPVEIWGIVDGRTRVLGYVTQERFRVIEVRLRYVDVDIRCLDNTKLVFEASFVDARYARTIPLKNIVPGSDYYETEERAEVMCESLNAIANARFEQDSAELRSKNMVVVE